MPQKGKKSVHAIERFFASGMPDWQEFQDMTEEDLDKAYGGLLTKRNAYCPLLLPETDVSNGEPKSRESSASKGRESMSNHKCSAAGCVDNPHCLNWLGQELWEGEGLKKYIDKHGLSHNPNDLARDPDTPVGLKNLGSTCYISSYLQTWFQNINFRNGVFKCAVASTSNVKIEDLPLFQLQVAFAAMQQGPTNVFNPQPLVKSLKIPEAEQQDATEFGKLFIGLLDLQFKKQADPALKTLITDMFEGLRKYKTQCNVCKRVSERSEAFLELEINIKAGCRLEDRIEALLAKECLSGDNKYYCEECNQLVDAIRSQEIDRLPPVLHLSLMRFVFDMALMDRKKSSSFIAYPKALDMTPFIVKGDSVPCIYDLKAVLLHKGASAHHGHYVAQVFDETHQKWFTCDDEYVSEYKEKSKKTAAGKDLPKASRNGPTQHERKTFGSKRKSSVIDLTSDGDSGNEAPAVLSPDLTSRSKDAYLLVYTLRHQNATACAADTISLPTLVQATIDSMAQIWAAECDEFNNKAAKLSADFESEKASKRAIYSNILPKDDDSVAYLMDKAILKTVIQGSLQPKPKKRRNVETSEANEKSETPEDLNVAAEEKADVALEPPTSTESNEAVTDHVHAAQIAVVALNNENIICPHGRLDPFTISQCKIISENAQTHIVSQGFSISPTLSSSDAYCSTCLWIRFTSENYDMQHKADVEGYNAARKLNVDTTTPMRWISSTWLQEWQKLVPSFHNADTGADPAPDSAEFRSDTLCEHGNLQPKMSKRVLITESGYRYLHNLFPKWTAFPKQASKCPLCSSNIENMSPEELVNLAVEEKTILRSLSTEPTRTHQGPKDAVAFTDQNLYVVPKQWLKFWRKWIAQPSVTDRPDLDLSPFLCHHNGLIVNLEKESHHMTMVLETEWAYISKQYQPVGCIAFTFIEGELVVLEPSRCSTCIECAKSNWAKLPLKVYRLNESDFEENGEKKLWNMFDPPLPISEISILDTQGSTTSTFYSSKAGTSRATAIGIDAPLRRSSRPTKQTTLDFTKRNKTREYKKIEIEPADTVKDLKIAIADAMKVPTIYQRLWLYDQEMDDSAMTLKSLGIKAGDFIQLSSVRSEKDDDVVDLGKLDDHLPRKRRRTNGSEGFHSTGLYGYDTAESETECSEAERIEDASTIDDISLDVGQQLDPTEAAAKACGVCTLLNPLDAVVCSVCDSAFSY